MYYHLLNKIMPIDICIYEFYLLYWKLLFFKQNTETTLKTVVHLVDAQLSPTELEVLNLGLKFVPTPKQDPTA